jgi:hypothetical protein
VAELEMNHQSWKRIWEFLQLVEHDLQVEEVYALQGKILQQAKS